MVHRRVRGGKYKIKHVEKQCPVTLGDELEVNITDICPSGDGTSMIQGYIIQVPKAKPRDHVKVKITSIASPPTIINSILPIKANAKPKLFVELVEVSDKLFTS